MARGYDISIRGKYLYESPTNSNEYVSTAKAAYLTRSDARPGGLLPGGFQKPTAYFAKSTKQEGPYGSVKSDHSGGIERTGDLFAVSSGSFMAVGWSMPDFEPSLVKRATMKMLEDMQDTFGSTNLAQSFAERQQTVDLITNNATKCLTAYRHARKGRWKKAYRALDIGAKPAKDLSTRILEFNYGVRPLVQDVYSSIQTASTPVQGASELLQFDGKAQEGSLSTSRTVLDTYSIALPMSLSFSEQRNCKVRVFARIKNGPAVSAARTGLTNPALLAWELLPFSFVADWFLPVGDWLNALDATLGYEFVTGYVSERAETFTRFAGLDHQYPTRRVRSNVAGFRRCKNFKRTVLTSFPFPPFPDLKSPVSAEHALNAVALFGAMRR